MMTHTPAAPREAPARRADAPIVDPAIWQQILHTVRLQHPSLNRVWFDQLVPRHLTNGVIQVTVTRAAELNFCQSQCQQPFPAAAQQVTGRLVAVTFHCENLPRGGVFNEGEQAVPLNPDYTFDPRMWPEVKNVDRKLTIPPGPRNPVGLCWIGLAVPGVGIHGSPAPEMIGKTGSHGCFRLTNWDALRLSTMVRIGTPVRFVG